MIQVWISKDENANVAALVEKLNALVASKSGAADLGDKTRKLLRGFVVFADVARQADAEKIAADKKPEKISVGYLPAENRAESATYKVSPDVKNTVFVVSGKKVVAKFVDVTAADFDQVAKAAADIK
jgi:hypothetical protein